MPIADRVVEGVLSGDARAIARAISLIEDDHPSGVGLLRALFPRTGRARVIGVTGPSGAGKSTLVDRLTLAFRERGDAVGVIAVDPTSPFSGGAVLGDRVRMSRHFADPGVFIRSMATRGHLGGLARATADAALVLDAAGKGVILIETVGVGQGEVDIARTSDVCVVILVPGSGDEVQTLKAGIMEIADVFVVNQADREGADRLVQAIAASQSLRPAAPGEWRPPIVKTVATTGEGVVELGEAIERFRAHAASSTGPRRRRDREAVHLRELLAHRCLQQLEQALPSGELDGIVDRIAAREIDPYSAAADLMTRLTAAAASGRSGSRSPDADSRSGFRSPTLEPR